MKKNLRLLGSTVVAIAAGILVARCGTNNAATTVSVAGLTLGNTAAPLGGVRGSELRVCTSSRGRAHGRGDRQHDVS